MKKLIIAASLYLFSSQHADAQFYGQRQYANLNSTNNVISSSAVVTSVYSQGYLAASYVPSASTPTWQINVRKTDLDGNYSTTDEFNLHYFIYNSIVDCALNPSLATDCGGVSAIETNIGAPPTGSRYALVATFGGASSGNFLAFITLDQVGNVVNNVYYDFPVSVASFKQPYIIEDSSSPGNFYICGSYVGSASGSNPTMYVLKVNTAGTIIQSVSYTGGNGIEPGAIINSPFNSGEIAIVGQVVPSPNSPPFQNRSQDGFFMRLDATTLNSILFRAYGTTTSQHHFFSSIAPAFSSAGGSQGFVVGGYSDRINPGGPQGTWMLKIHHTTGAIVWSTIIDNGGIGFNGLATGVFERFNAGSYTYFGAGSMASSVRAIKLNGAGSLFSGSNVFDYNWLSPGTPGTYPTQLTYLTGSSADGFQLFSTNGSASGQDHYFVKAYFDGQSGCSESPSFGVESAGPTNTISPTVMQGSGLMAGSCQKFMVVWDAALSNTNNLSTNCSATSILGASNARQINTGLENNNTRENEFKLFPNPNNGIFNIESKSDIRFSIINQMGQVIKTVELNSTNNFKIDVVDLSAGIYFIKAQGANQEKGYKFIVDK